MRSVEEIIRELPENIRGPIYEALIAFRDDVLLKETREIKFEIGKVWEAINELTKRLNDLTERVNDLTEAQKRTNQEIEKVWNAIKELTEAQKRTEQEIEKIWGAIRELTEAQRRTEQRLSELAEAQKKTEQTLNELKEEQKKTEQKFRELVEAQRKTEQTLNELKEEQKKTEQKFQELAEAQKITEQRINELTDVVKKTQEQIQKTQEQLKKLTEEHSKTREKLEGLSDSFGYLLEDRAMKSLPKILKREHKIEVVEKLKRDYFVVNGEYVEVNIFGRVRKGRKEYILLGEAKSRVSKKAIDNFVRKCDKISKRFSREVIKVFISYIFSPEIKEYAEEKGIILVPSYELEL
jgi:chromosome segregation ATPase